MMRQCIYYTCPRYVMLLGDLYMRYISIVYHKYNTYECVYIYIYAHIYIYIYFQNRQMEGPYHCWGVGILGLGHMK